MTIECNQVSDLITEHLPSTLSPEGLQMVLSHVGGCETCREKWGQATAEEETNRERVRRYWEALYPDAAFVDGLVEKVQQNYVIPKSRWPRWTGPARFAAAAVAVAIAILIVAASGTPGLADGVKKVIGGIVGYVRDRQVVENGAEDSIEYLLDQPYGDGRIVITSYLVGDNPTIKEGTRIAVLLRLDTSGEPIGGGAVGTVATVGTAPISVAWTWLGYPGSSDYAFYGVINGVSDVDTIELTEKDGTVSVIPVAGQKAFFLARSYSEKTGTGWEAQSPALIRALDAAGNVVYEKQG
jgi:hypothetical protein